MDIAAFADGHIKGYSVTAEIMHNMADATKIAKTAWTEVLTLGQAPLGRLQEACRQIQQVQE